jgi:hypothetical protein
MCTFTMWREPTAGARERATQDSRTSRRAFALDPCIKYNVRVPSSSPLVPPPEPLRPTLPPAAPWAEGLSTTRTQGWSPPSPAEDRLALPDCSLHFLHVDRPPPLAVVRRWVGDRSAPCPRLVEALLLLSCIGCDAALGAGWSFGDDCQREVGTARGW